MGQSSGAACKVLSHIVVLSAPVDPLDSHLRDSHSQARLDIDEGNYCRRWSNELVLVEAEAPSSASRVSPLPLLRSYRIVCAL